MTVDLLPAILLTSDCYFDTVNTDLMGIFAPFENLMKNSTLYRIVDCVIPI